MEKDILLVDKPKGISTYDIIRRIKKDFPKGTKIGHTGTLDPFATGLVILLLNKRTKEQDLFHQMKKTYITTAQFGIETDTQDITGEIIQKEDVSEFSKEKIFKAIQENFLGEIQQIPPKFSAKQINGVRAYKLARKGEEFKLNPKTITIYRFEILDIKWPNVTFEIECGSGTYIRTLINDLGHKLKTYATCISLRRTNIGEYNVENTVKLKD